MNPLDFLFFLTDIGPLLGGRIFSQLEKEVVPSLDTTLRMAGGNSLSFQLHHIYLTSV